MIKRLLEHLDDKDLDLLEELDKELSGIGLVPTDRERAIGAVIDSLIDWRVVLPPPWGPILEALDGPLASHLPALGRLAWRAITKRKRRRRRGAAPETSPPFDPVAEPPGDRPPSPVAEPTSSEAVRR